MLTRHEYDKHVASALRRERLKKGFTQEQMGARIGVYSATYGEYERAVTRVSAGTLKAISEVLNVPVASFYPDNCPQGGAT